MKCYLHIGTEKTGTSTLQAFLDQNREGLRKSGFAFTQSAGRRNNMNLLVAAYKLERRDDLTSTAGVQSNEELLDFQEKTIAGLRAELAEMACDNMIFSSEHIQSRLTEIAEIHRLKDILLALGATDIRVVVYLRNPAEIANSLYSTLIKSGSTVKQPCAPQNSYFHNVCNHRGTLQRYASVFGQEALMPRLFHPDELLNGSIVDDFTNAIGLPLAADYLMPERLNESLSATGIQILRRVNEIIPIGVGDQINPARIGIVRHFEEHFGGEKYSMPNRLYKKYVAAFRESNEWVRRNWFPAREILFPETEYPAETKCKIPPAELDKIAQVLAAIWLEGANKETPPPQPLPVVSALSPPEKPTPFRWWSRRQRNT
jgi:hypothetical protein